MLVLEEREETKSVIGFKTPPLNVTRFPDVEAWTRIGHSASAETQRVHLATRDQQVSILYPETTSQTPRGVLTRGDPTAQRGLLV